MASERAKALSRTLLDGSPDEEQEQIGLFEVMEWHIGRWPELRLAYHPANGGKRTKTQAKRLKAMGVKPGVPDVAIPVPRRGYAGMYCEMKRTDAVPSDTRANQRQWRDDLIEQGYYAVIARGGAEAWAMIRWYMEGARTITMGVDATGKMP